MTLKTVSKRKKPKRLMKSQFDAQGSYTGTDYFDEYEKPVQDADDL